MLTQKTGELTVIDSACTRGKCIMEYLKALSYVAMLPASCTLLLQL